uniref:Actin-binding lim zn-finger protein limatin involved in axon guidance n=1 Tax=Toxocara canis TaxID=6265 RepID=A0A183UHX5_TOXCA
LHISVCAACEQPLQTGQVLLALGEQWHVWCFKCSECAAVLQGEYMAHEGKPLCIRDYNLKYGVRCYECEKYIAGKVLQAGGYKFHPTCARCSRCGEHFGDGEEMYMQGDEIWHPHCEHSRTTENLARSPGKGAGLRSRDEPKYHTHFGQHLTYMYLLPEAEQTYLKHPIAPHPPQPAQFHTPQGPVKIRKSRMSMLKTGMQRLTEDLERNTPRARSPHMDNEEPIEMAHYPAGHAPDPSVLPPIEREDFPAPPYPYAVEELKRRLSSSSVENDDDDEDDYDEADKLDEEKLKRAVEQLDTYDKDSSIAHVIKQNLEEAHKKQRLPLHWDPRNASRTPSAKKMSHLRFRYDTPINASPSRHLNRPKPWMYWQGGKDKAATTSIPFFHVPQRVGLSGRAATLPDGYHYGQDMSMDGLDTTISSHFSDQSLDGGQGGTLPAGYMMHGATMNGTSEVRAALRSSLPDMSKPAKTYPLTELQTSNKKLPEDVDREHLERHLNRAEFEEIFSMSPIEFYKLPEWKRINLKRKAKLF